MRLALADQSDTVLWTGQQWALIAAAATFLAVAWAIRELRRAPTKPADLSNLDTADGVTYTPRCVMAHCGLAGTIARVTRADLGIETVRVCPGHADEGATKGWWVSPGGIPYDQENAS